MKTQNYLDYEIILLLAKYGERQVINVLAKNLQISPDILEEKLREITKIKPRVTKKTRTNHETLIESIAIQNPDKSEYLKILFSRFQNRTFLPEFKNVKHFSNKHGFDLGKVKSRKEAIPTLFKKIASLNVEALSEIINTFKEGEYSSLGIIADEIMKRDK